MVLTYKGYTVMKRDGSVPYAVVFAEPRLPASAHPDPERYSIAAVVACIALPSKASGASVRDHAAALSAEFVGAYASKNGAAFFPAVAVTPGVPADVLFRLERDMFSEVKPLGEVAIPEGANVLMITPRGRANLIIPAKAALEVLVGNSS